MLRKVKGVRDILPPESIKFTYVIEKFRKIVSRFGYEEIITPTLEYFELFEKKSGVEISKTMYVFKDKKGLILALRPEVTPSIARIYINYLKSSPLPVRLFYVANCFRYEEPQRARYREFWQAGVECIGLKEPYGELETLTMVDTLMNELKIPVSIRIGDMAIWRSIFDYYLIPDEKQQLLFTALDKGDNETFTNLVQEYVPPKAINMFQRLMQIKGSNVSSLCAECRRILSDYGFSEIEGRIDFIEELSLSLKLSRNSRIILDMGFARGLAYYTGIIFEVYSSNLDVAIGGGGRYDSLIEVFGGPPTPAIGFAIGVDRVSMALNYDVKTSPRILLVPVKPEYISAALNAQVILARKGMCTEVEYKRDLRKALKYANNRDIPFVAIIGSEFVSEGKVTIKDMMRRTQHVISLEKIADIVAGQGSS
ncbi:histidine--tRNA ligase [archaeon]|nr:MAG: histidine--tRNA ligase [archaeon]